FFQAEDGIRDRNVTGVQTCALPISGEVLAEVEDEEAFERKRHGSSISSIRTRRPSSADRYAHMRTRRVLRLSRPDVSGSRSSSRSEERRVGKEGRPRWARDRGKKK